jgi:outer membrane protein TolC
MIKTRALLVASLVALTSFPVIAASQELTLSEALQAAQEHHPTIVASRLAQENAQRNLSMTASAYGLHVNIDGRPLLGTGVQMEKSVPTNYTKGDLRLNASLSTPWGLSSTAVLTHSYKLDNAANTSLSISANAPLDAASVMYNSARLAMGGQTQAYAKAVWDCQQQERQVVINTLRTYWQLELDAARLQLSRAELAAKAEAYQQVFNKAANGGATDADLLSALIELRQVEASLHKLEVSYYTQLEQFALDLGLSTAPGQLPVLASSGFVTKEQLTSFFDQVALEEAAATTSLTVMKKQLDLYTAEEKMNATRLGLLPTATLSTNYTIPSLGRLNWANSTWNVNINVSLPVIDGGERKLTMQSQQVALQAAQTALEQARNDARRYLQRKLVEWQLAQADTEIALLKLEQAHLQKAVKAEHFKLGALTAADTEAAARACQHAALNLQAAVNTQYLAELEIALIVGAPLMLGEHNLHQ